MYTRFEIRAKAGPCGGCDVRHRRMVDASTCNNSASSLELYQYSPRSLIALSPFPQRISRGKALLLGTGECGQNEDAVAQAAMA